MSCPPGIPPEGKIVNAIKLSELARLHTLDAIKICVEIMNKKTAPEAARLRAVEILLERGHGRVPQHMQIEGLINSEIIYRRVEDVVEYFKAKGWPVERKKLSPCLVGMEACGGSHYWAREITRLGHDVRLVPPPYVKPFVRRGKTDAADAEAICEAVIRKTMRFVPVESADQQAAAMVLKTRELLVRQRTQAINTHC